MSTAAASSSTATTGSAQNQVSTPRTAGGSTSNGFAFPAQSVGSSSTSQAGPVETVDRSDKGATASRNDPAVHHAMNVCDSIWQVGFQGGRYSDIEFKVRNRSYHLHRLILSRSPYLAHLMDISAPHEPVRIQIGDEEITDEAMAISLGHLYAPYAVQMIHSNNSRSVLLASIFLALPDLSSLAYTICRQSITSQTIRDWITWFDAREEKATRESERRREKQSGSETGSLGDLLSGGGIGDYINGSLASVIGLNGNANGSGNGSGNMTPVETSKGGGTWAGVGAEGLQRDDWIGRLRADVKNYLAHSYASDLSRTSSSPLTSNPDFISTFTSLPFELFKSLLEDATFTALGNDQERFGFAKKLILQRKKGNGPGKGSMENVVLSFGGGNGSNVHVTRKTTARNLWKVEKD